MHWEDRLDQLFIGGEWTKPAHSDVLKVISPATEQLVATVSSARQDDVDAAVAAARAAFDHGPWPRRAVAERLEVMHRFAEIFRSRQAEIAEVVTREMGCPITMSKVVQAAVPQAILDAYLEVATTFPFSSTRQAGTGSAVVTREPVGVVAAVVPWNVPLSVTMQKLAPALIAGCTLVLKPAPETPLSAFLLAAMLEEAGVEKGVVSVVPADREVSEHLVRHPGVDKVTFTGSTRAGRRIASLCGENLKRVTLELGGKSAAVFLDDADLDAAVESLRMGSFRNSGQVCSLKTRLVVSRRREQELVERLEALVRSMPVGDPADPATQIGPMVSERHRGVVEGYLQLGKDEGATAVVGGGRPAGLERGWFVEPTVFTGVTPQMRIAQEEIFGPVVTVLTYQDEEEAVAIANDSTYGLNGAVYSADVEHALRVARRIRTGTVEINGSPAGLHAPMGGFKESGIGREGGHEGLEGYVEPKSYGLPPAYVAGLA